MNRVWKLLEVDEAELSALSAETGVPPILMRIMMNRGLREPQAIERFFEARSRGLASPFLLEGICPAVDRILRALRSQESIRVYGDRDVDGITSTVLLWETLKELGARADFTIPVIEDGYGLNRDYIDSAKRDGVSLIVTVDCGISNVAEVEYARNLDIDVIVTDHHETPAVLPRAVALIDPKSPDSQYPHKDMAGVGVSLKLGLALVLASAKALSGPVLAFDCEGPEIDMVRFTPTEGFTRVKHFSIQSLAGATLLFFDRKEQNSVAEILPEITPQPHYARGPGARVSPFETKAGSTIFLAELLPNCIPESADWEKTRLLAELNIPSANSGARRLIVMYLKLLEAMEPAVKALWQRALDILSIGTIADMVPLKGENRIIAQMGLKFITRTKRLGLQELYNLLGWKQKTVSERDVSFSIAPILNSSGRLKTAELAIDLLTTPDPKHAESLARELFDLNIERKRLAEECYRQVKEHLISQNDIEKSRILLVNAPIPNQGVTGIVATRLMLDYCRPVIVLLEDHGKFLGSARSYKGINVMNALNSCSHVLEKYGGHIGAAGLTLHPDKVPEFRRCLMEYSQKNISDDDLQAEWLIDAVIDLDLVTEGFLDDLLRFSPFGIENPAPLFMARQARFYEVRKVGEGKNHLRFKFRKSTGQAIFGIGFNLAREVPQDQMSDGTCDLVFTIEANDYNGTRSAQVVVCDVIFGNQNVGQTAPKGESPG